MNRGTVIVIDDSAFSRSRFAAKPLRDAGYKVIEGDNGEEGLKLVDAHHADCIVSDLLMPVLDGFGVLEALAVSYPEIPVIVASADIQESSIERCQSLGAKAFINKPFKPDQLLNVVTAAISGAAT